MREELSLVELRRIVGKPPAVRVLAEEARSVSGLRQVAAWSTLVEFAGIEVVDPRIVRVAARHCRWGDG